LIAEATIAADVEARQLCFAGVRRQDALQTILPLLRCPTDCSELIWDQVSSQLVCAQGAHCFPVEADIPRLFAPNDWPRGKPDVTEAVKEFYETSPFPNYDGLDTRDSLRHRVGAASFGRMVDEQLPHTARILEIGCGTGRMTNFLGMGWGRTVIGADLCMNSLKLAKEFRDRFEINNAYFAQINLFRPPFVRAGFDVVVSDGVLHHTSDCCGAFRSIAQLVKPGGIIIVGLYNWLGRLPTLWRRRVIKGGRYPHETRHSMDEVLGWFESEGFNFTGSIPIIDDAEFSEQMPLFEVRSAGRRRDRVASEIEMLLTGGKDRGKFVMIGRKRL